RRAGWPRLRRAEPFVSASRNAAGLGQRRDATPRSLTFGAPPLETTRTLSFFLVLTEKRILSNEPSGRSAELRVGKIATDSQRKNAKPSGSDQLSRTRIQRDERPHPIEPNPDEAIYGEQPRTAGVPPRARRPV